MRDEGVERTEEALDRGLVGQRVTRDGGLVDDDAVHDDRTGDRGGVAGVLVRPLPAVRRGRGADGSEGLADDGALAIGAVLIYWNFIKTE